MAIVGKVRPFANATYLGGQLNEDHLCQAERLKTLCSKRQVELSFLMPCLFQCTFYHHDLAYRNDEKLLTCEDNCNVTACSLAAGSRSFKYIAPHAIISSNKGAILGICISSWSLPSYYYTYRAQWQHQS